MAINIKVSNLATAIVNSITSLIATHNTNNSAHSTLFNNKENTSNKVQSSGTLSSSSTDTQYPSAKLVYNELQGINTSKISNNATLSNIGSNLSSQADINAAINQKIGDAITYINQ